MIHSWHPTSIQLRKGRTKTRSRACTASRAAPTPRTSPADARWEERWPARGGTEKFDRHRPGKGGDHLEKPWKTAVLQDFTIKNVDAWWFWVVFYWMFRSNIGELNSTHGDFTWLNQWNWDLKGWFYQRKWRFKIVQLKQKVESVMLDGCFQN